VHLIRILIMSAATVTIASGATWQEVAADRQAYRAATLAAIKPALPDLASIPLSTIPLAKEFLTAAEIKITETTVEELVPQLAVGKLSAVEVANAFLRRAGLAQKAVRLLPLPAFCYPG
jgi:amidase